jgi:GNAT superfamily N-acetyltransferase
VNPPRIRDAVPGDADDLADLLCQLGHPAEAGEVGERLRRLEERVLVAESGGRLMGLLTLTRHRFLSEAEPVARVTALVVRDSARGRGVGRLLMARAADIAATWGCDSVELTSGIRPERADAHRFYESLGFERTSYRFYRRL